MKTVMAVDMNWTFVLKTFFQLNCTIITLMIVSYCVYRYKGDDDVSRVSFELFHENTEYLYPATTLCIYNPFVGHKLEGYGSGINITTYSKFLQGKYNDSRMLRIPYDNVTLSLEDVFVQVSVKLQNNSLIWMHDSKNNDSIFHPNKSEKGSSLIYVNYRSGIKKCFSVEIPYFHQKLVRSLFIKIKANIFHNGKRPATTRFDGNDVDEGGFKVAFHYPMQYYRSYGTWKYQWESITLKKLGNIECSGYYMRFHIRGIEVLKRRNKPREACNENWQIDDNNVTLRLSNVVGCRLFYQQNQMNNLTFCKNAKDIQKILDPTHDELRVTPDPCREIKRLKYEYEEGIELPPRTKEACRLRPNDWYLLQIYFKENTFKNIRHVRDYDFDGMFGNIAGYIGFILGCSVVRFPELIIILYVYIKNLIIDNVKLN